MHHYGFRRGSINEESDEFSVVLFNEDTEGELVITGKVSETLDISGGGAPTVEYVGEVIADALNEATRRGGGALA